MIRRNLGLVGLDAEAERACTLPVRDGDLVPADIDGRLHAWEWMIEPNGRLLKADALDHAVAHDLLGAQDIAWDVAGAVVEFDLAPAEAERLRLATQEGAGRRVEPAVVAFMTAAYLAFQIGWWTMAAGGVEGVRAAREARRYEEYCRCRTARA